MSTAPARPVGHQRVLERLERAAALAEESDGARGLPHALLFSGPAGVGKWTAALWWSRVLHCRQSGGCEPTCADCKRIGAGTNPDVIAIEPETPGKALSIDQVRDLIRRMALRSAGGRPRLALVRDAHLLTIEAQSALLKLLEEPPGRGVIVLVTENPSALLPTVRSRCLAVRFGAVPPDHIESLLARAGRDADTARRAAALAGGSVGRALGLSPETIEDRDKLITAIEALRNSEPTEIEQQAIALAERAKQGKVGLEELFQWSLVRIEAALGYEAPAESAMLAQLLATTEPGELHRLLATADGIRRALDALDRNANARLTVRELLLDLGEG